MRDAFLKSITILAENDNDLVLLTADLGFGVFEEFESRFPNQYFNVGVAEQNMTGVAVGLSLEGKKVITYSIGNFPILRCLEQIRNDACYHEANITVVGSGGGFSYGALGMSHHATEDIAIMRALPNMQVLVPSTKKQASDAVKIMLDYQGPSYLRIDKGFATINDPCHSIKLGKINIIAQGQSVIIAVTGAILQEVLDATVILKECGINCSIIEVPSIKPLNDPELNKSG